MDGPRISFGSFLRRTWFVWAALIAAYALVAASLPPMDDEVYYWSWSKTPQLSYYDHPGMTAWLIWLSTRIFGDTILGMRFPACCCTAFTLAAIAYLMQSPPTVSAGTTLLRSVAKSPILIGVALTPLFTFGGILITPDAPLIAAWMAYVLWMTAIHTAMQEQHLRSKCSTLWLIGGVILGLGGLSKYTMILAVPAGFVAFAISGLPWRRWFGWYVLHGIVAMAVASPILTYNFQHDFEPLRFQWRHAMNDEPATVVTFLEFFGVQLLLFGTIPFYLVPWSLRHFHALRSDPRVRVSSAFHLIPFVFFIYKAARTELEGNWGLVAFLSVWTVAAAWYETVKASRLWRWLTAASFLPPVIAVIGLTAIIVSPVSLLPPQWDRLSKQRARWEMVQHLANDIKSRNENIPTFTKTYQMTALLRFHGIDARQYGNLRPSHYTFPLQRFQDHAESYFVLDAGDELDWHYLRETLLGAFETRVRGETVQEYRLLRLDTPTAAPAEKEPRAK